VEHIGLYLSIEQTKRQQLVDITMDKESDCELSKWLLKQLARFRLTGDVVKQYVNSFIHDGWNNVDSIEEYLDDEKYLDFMPRAHKGVLMKSLKEIRERRADGQEPTDTPGASPPRNEAVDDEDAEPPQKPDDENSKKQSAAATDYTFDEYIDLSKHNRDDKEALKTYKETNRWGS
jgi:hypothetical protein